MNTAQAEALVALIGAELDERVAALQATAAPAPRPTPVENHGKPRLHYSDFVAYRRLQAEAEAGHIALHGTPSTGRDPLDGVQVVPDPPATRTKAAAPARIDEVAGQVVGAVQAYVARNLGPLVARIAALEARVPQE